MLEKIIHSFLAFSEVRDLKKLKKFTLNRYFHSKN